MFFLFGWGHQTKKNYGITFQNKCSHCNNEDYWQLARFTTWFTLFFLPIIPYENKYFLFCPVCERGVYLDSSRANELKPYAEALTALAEQKISSEEFQSRISQLKLSNTNNMVEGEVGEIGVMEENKNSNDSIYCVHCGKQNSDEAKFCFDCGKKLLNKINK